MRLNTYLFFLIIIFALILLACSSSNNTATEKMDGIELELAINKQEITTDDDLVVTVTLTNHNDSQRKLFVPIPVDVEEGISAVMVEKKNQLSGQLLNPSSNGSLPNIKGRSFYDYVVVDLGAKETIEQEFSWDKRLFNQEKREIVEADSGNYIVSTFVLLDELTTQEDYFEPEKQLISKLTYKVK